MLLQSSAKSKNNSATERTYENVFKIKSVKLTKCVVKELFRKLTFNVHDSPTLVGGKVYRSSGAYTPRVISFCLV